VKKQSRPTGHTASQIHSVDSLIKRMQSESLGDLKEYIREQLSASEQRLSSEMNNLVDELLAALNGDKPEAEREHMHEPDVLERVGFSRATLRRRIKEGDFPAPVQIGPGRIGWRVEDVKAWLQQRKHGVPERWKEAMQKRQKSAVAASVAAVEMRRKKLEFINAEFEAGSTRSDAELKWEKEKQRLQLLKSELRDREVQK